MNDRFFTRGGMTQASHVSSRTLDRAGLLTLAVAALCLVAAFETVHHMLMGVFMGLFIASLGMSVAMLAWTRVGFSKSPPVAAQASWARM
jgi:hypothetical protein